MKLSQISYLKLLLGSLLVCVCLVGCYDPPPPERVYVAAADVKTSLTIAPSTTKTTVNKPVILYASRTTSGIMEVPYEDVPPGAQWWRQMPPAYEKEVAANLRWIVKPEGKAKFNTNFRRDHTREVRFTEPGTYEIYGISTGPGAEPVKSKTIVIEVGE